MTKKKITLLDYGLGNLWSVSRAFEQLGASVTITQDPVQVKNADYLVLPGVGAFGRAMQTLREQPALIPAIFDFCATGRPFLGICLGMQLLFESSQEFSTETGLGLVKGVVQPLSGLKENQTPLRLPHIGWSQVRFLHIDENEFFYFAHSFQVVPQDPTCIQALTTYGVNTIPAVIQHNHLTGYQFHPEKSGEVGLRLLGQWFAS